MAKASKANENGGNESAKKARKRHGSSIWRNGEHGGENEDINVMALWRRWRK